MNVYVIICHTDSPSFVLNTCYSSRRKAVEAAQKGLDMSAVTWAGDDLVDQNYELIYTVLKCKLEA